MTPPAWRRGRWVRGPGDMERAGLPAPLLGSPIVWCYAVGTWQAQLPWRACWPALPCSASPAMHAPAARQVNSLPRPPPGAGPLLGWAQAAVPRRRWAATPVFLFGTAGLRKLRWGRCSAAAASRASGGLGVGPISQQVRRLAGARAPPMLVATAGPKLLLPCRALPKPVAPPSPPPATCAARSSRGGCWRGRATFWAALPSASARPGPASSAARTRASTAG